MKTKNEQSLYLHRISIIYFKIKGRKIIKYLNEKSYFEFGYSFIYKLYEFWSHSFSRI